MILAWMVCASFAALMPRYCKKAWPGKKIAGIDIWFRVIVLYRFVHAWCCMVCYCKLMYRMVSCGVVCYSMLLYRVYGVFQGVFLDSVQSTIYRTAAVDLVN